MTPPPFALASYVHDAFAAEARAQVFAIAEALAAAPAGHVVVACESPHAFAFALLGAWQAMRTVELPPSTSPAAIRSLREAPHVAVLLHDRDGEEGFDVRPVLASATATATATTPPPNGAELRAIAADAPLVTLHTSGTTAAPKRVVKLARELLGEVEALAAAFGRAGATYGRELHGPVLCTVSSFQLYGLLFGILLPLRLGLAVVNARPMFPAEVTGAIQASRARTLVTTPSHLRALCKNGLPPGLSVVSSGAPLDGALTAELALRYGSRVHDVLGSSETGGIATRSGQALTWSPLAGVTVSADDDEAMTVASAWSSTARGADRIRLHPDGTFSLLGRNDDIIKVGGKRVDLGALQAVIAGVAGVTDVALGTYPDAGRGVRPFAVIAPASASPELVRSTLAEWFDPVVVPRIVVATATIPRTERGKTVLAELLQLAGIAELPRTRDVRLVPTSRPDTYALYIDPQLVFLDGHFPDFPIVPGVVPLAEWALPVVRRRFDDLGPLLRIARARFRRPVFADRHAELTLTRDGQCVRYQLHCDGELAASANLHFGPAVNPGDP